MSEDKKADEKPKKKEKIIGIDLGTSNSACSVLSATGKPEIIPAAEGRTLGGKAFPSYVAFDENGRKIVGEDPSGFHRLHAGPGPALRQKRQSPERMLETGSGTSGRRAACTERRGMCPVPVRWPRRPCWSPLPGDSGTPRRCLGANRRPNGCS